MYNRDAYEVERLAALLAELEVPTDLLLEIRRLLAVTTASPQSTLADFLISRYGDAAIKRARELERLFPDDLFAPKVTAELLRRSENSSSLN